MGTWTSAGLNLVASAVQSVGAQCAITYVALSLGCGTLASALTSGLAYTSLPLDATLPVGLATGVSLTLTDGVNTQTVTTSANVSAGAPAIPVTSFTASHSFAAHTTGVAPTPLSSALSLYNESQRVAANVGTAGASAGESLTSGYFDGTQPTGLYLLVGYFGGSTATSALGTGTLMQLDVQYWSHTLETDSNMYQSDSTV